MNPVLVGIVTALRQELSAVRAAIAVLPSEHRAWVRVLQGGVGSTAAAEAARDLCQNSGLKILCVSGYSGGLIDTLGHGAIVLGSEVDEFYGPKDKESAATVIKSKPDRFMTNKTNAMAEAAMKKKGIPCRVGTLASVARPLFNSEEKRVLGRTLNALAVDMESAAVARVAAEHGRAFFALRAISDTVDENLPSEVSDFLDETGEVRSGKVLKFAFHGPKNVRELWKLKRHSDQAALALQGAWKAVLPAFLETARAMPGPTDCP